jgi:predicted phosphodiesterase
VTGPGQSHLCDVRLLILSDLHLELGEWDPPAASADAVVLAGDIHGGANGVEWASEVFGGLPVIYVAGNHEYYGTAIPKATEKLRDTAEGRGLHFLERDSVVIAGIRFLGATLWTDFALTGDMTGAAAAAGRSMLDYRRIRLTPDYRRLRPLHTRKWHQDTLAWLKQELAAATEPTVVVTHHAPSGQSIQPRFQGDLLSPAFASGLNDFIAHSGSRLWVHGHTHHCVDYEVGSTRIVSNQRGYPDEIVSRFKPDFTVVL